MNKMICGLVLIASMICMFSAVAAKAEGKQAAQVKNLVVYYSYNGHTELVAKTLAGIIKADIIKIEDVARPSKDEVYSSGKAAATQGKAWPIKPFKTDVSGYDRIFVGSPVWFGMPTPELNAFVEQVGFAGKQVVVFVTMGSGGQDSAIKAMTEKITAKGGKVVSSFSVKTGLIKHEDIEEKTKEISKQYSQSAP